MPIKSNPVGSGHVSHRRTSSFNIFDYGFGVCKNVRLKLNLRRMCVGGHIIHITQLINLLSSFDFLGLGFGMLVCLGWTLSIVERNTSITTSQRSRASTPSISNPPSREIISDSAELCETAVCFLHIQLIGTNVQLPKIHQTPLEVDFVSSRSP